MSNMITNWKMQAARIAMGTALAGLAAAAVMYAFLGAPRRAAAGQAAPAQTPPAQRAPGSAPAPQQDRAPSAVIEPADLVKELSAHDKPIVVCVGPSALYEGAHVPDAVFHGAAGTPKGLADLKQWAATLPKSANIVAYCGCCPLSKCPNIRPALAALRQLGFTHAQVLRLPTDFNTDWIAKGYPVEKGQ